MPVRRLGPNPNLDHLKYQARDLLKQHAARLPETAQRIREFHPRFARASDDEIFTSALKLSDAQRTIAREYGFSSWARLKRHIESPTLVDRLDLPHHERIEDLTFRRAVEMIDAGDVAKLRALLKQHPKLVHQRLLFEGGNYFQTPSLLEFVAENPVRRGTLPENIVDVARVILDAGPDVASVNETLMLVATGSVARERGVQVALVELLCEFGAYADAAARLAAVLSEHESVRALIRNGATVDLPIAAALGLVAEFDALFKGAGAEDRHLALAVAAQHGHVEIVGRLLDSGEDPNRYNPRGGHSHGTPLHHAAAGGHDAVVRMLVERKAKTDLRDVLWGGTAADWAAHEGRTEVEMYLRQKEKAHLLRD